MKDRNATDKAQSGAGPAGRYRIAAHILYPGAIVLLLASGIAGSLGVLWASRSDGGVSIVPDYYQRAVQWDQEMQIEHDSRGLGWSVRATQVDRGTVVILEIVDASGEAVAGLEGVVRATRADEAEPALVAAIHNSAISADKSMAVPIARTGLWYLEVDVSSGENRFVGSTRLEVVGGGRTR